MCKTVGRVLKKLKIEISHDSSIPHMGIFLKELKSGSQRGKSIPMFNTAMVTIIKMWKQCDHSLINKWIKEIQDTHKMEHYSSLKKEGGNSAISDNKDRPWENYTKWNKPDTEDNYYIILPIWGIRNSQIHRLKDLNGGSQGVGEGAKESCYSLGKNFQLNRVTSAQSCLTLCNPMNYTVHGILQARILEWVAYPFSSGSSQPRNRTRVSCIAGKFFTSWVMRDAPLYQSVILLKMC